MFPGRLDFFVYKYIKNIFYSAEQQRNQALQNAEGLKEAFKDYKATMSAKYQKVKLLVFVIILVCMCLKKTYLDACLMND